MPCPSRYEHAGLESLVEGRALSREEGIMRERGSVLDVLRGLGSTVPRGTNRQTTT